MSRTSELTEQLGEDVEPGPLPPIGSPLQIRALQIAAEEIAAGVREDPPGSNSGPRVNAYLLGHDMGGDWLVAYAPRAKPWCCRAAVWCYIEAARQLGLPDPFRGAANGGGLASGLKLLKWARAAGAVRMICRPGLIGVIAHEDGSSHVVMCWEIREGARFVSAEGNSRNRFRFVLREIAEVTFWIDVG
jgi:hypothetical protein